MLIQIETGRGGGLNPRSVVRSSFLSMGDDRSDVKASTSSALYLTLAAAWTASLCMGTALGYSSPASESLRTADVSPDETFWFGSMLALGAALGCMAGCHLAQMVGRRYTLLVCAVGFGGAWICLFTASTTLLLYIGRFSTGFFTGIVSLCVPTYIAEVATPASRGPLGGCLQLAITVGILYSFTIGRFLDWSWLALSCTIPALVLGSLSQFCVESPRWLLLHDQRKRATEALRLLRSSDADVKDECHAIETTFASVPIPGTHVLLALHVMFLQQFSGINMIIFYSSTTFDNAGLSLAASDVSILVGVLQVRHYRVPLGGPPSFGEKGTDGVNDLPRGQISVAIQK
ncbi:hypothetical protein HPB47_011592 [Ixodes persulcatus]|uniref:Uncharacterized protein n=1 Tax=Ixodes persulcatus TaxID=34615 RepID=A0AC60NW04_IXOPE|nr:hypothetical protein HPB47_011592 [Ixodes persulcatus]